MSRKNNLLVKKTSMSLNDRFTQIQHKARTVVGDEELVRPHRMHPFSMDRIDRRSEMPAPLMLNQEFPSRDLLRLPMPLLPRPEVNDRMYNSIMHDMLRSSERLSVPVHERLSLSRVPPMAEDRRRFRRKRGPKTKARGLPTSNMNGNASERVPSTVETTANRSRNRKRRSSKNREVFSHKEHVYSKEDLDNQLDQFMSNTKRQRDEELNRVLLDHD